MGKINKYKHLQGAVPKKAELAKTKAEAQQAKESENSLEESNAVKNENVEQKVALAVEGKVDSEVETSSSGTDVAGGETPPQPMEKQTLTKTERDPITDLGRVLSRKARRKLKDKKVQAINESDNIEEDIGIDCELNLKESKSSNSSVKEHNSGAIKKIPSPVVFKYSAERKYGTRGTTFNCKTNYLDLKIDKLPNVTYNYDIRITPDVQKKYWRAAFQQMCAEHFSGIEFAFDGTRTAFSTKRVPYKELQADVEVLDQSKKIICFNVFIRETENLEVNMTGLRTFFTGTKTDKPYRALQCLEVVLASACYEKAVRFGRSYFARPEVKCDLTEGYEMWLGLFQSPLMGNQLYLNVDISHKCFPTDCTVIAYLKNNHSDFSYDKPFSPLLLTKVKAYLKGIYVLYDPPFEMYLKLRNYRVLDVMDKPATDLQFPHEDGRRSTVYEYFKMFGYTLKYPRLNCLHLGNPKKDVYIPIEFCSITPDQILCRKTPQKQVLNMIKYSACSSTDRKKKIHNLLMKFKHNNDPKVRAFGLEIGKNFIEIPMRILRTPILEYDSRFKIEPFNGTWQINARCMKTSFTSYKWALLYPHTKTRLSYSRMYDFKEALLSVAKTMNIMLGKEPLITAYNNITELLQQLKKDHYDIVIVPVSQIGGKYSQIKQAAEIKVGILTQCIQENTIINSFSHQMLNNILIKINVKLKGVNHKIKLDKSLKNVMFVGADVTHPTTADQKNIPSVVGVVASHDAFGMSYNLQYRLQEPTVESIIDMHSICLHHLHRYKAKMSFYPSHIIFYRDGVSEGQFKMVRQVEIAGMRAACNELKIKPKFTCVVVVKRHHTRFFPDQERCHDKFCNVPPGSVVDSVIVPENEIQFFLVSHQCVRGTAKPTHYHVIEDEAALSMDTLQELTYDLCYTYPRCNRSVSYPAPAYMAHLVAARGRVYIDGQTNFADLNTEYEKRLIHNE